MAQNNKIITITLAALLAIFLQVLFVFADTQDTPNRAAKAFARAYFKYDKAGMADRLCEQARMKDQVNQINAYVYQARQEARDRGFDLGYMSDKLYHVDTELLEGDHQRALVRLTATRKNPLRSFFTGEKEHVEETFELIKEDGKWKVCGNPFLTLPQS